MKAFKYHQDAGHGWVAVKITLLSDLGILDDISTYSYLKGQTAYLEEDSDAEKFIAAYKKVHGEIRLQELHSDKSPIRLYRYFTPSEARQIIERHKKIYLK